MIGAAAVALGAGSLVRRRGGVDPSLVVVGTVAVVAAPAPAVAGGFLLWAVRRFRVAAEATRRAGRLDAAALESGDLIGLGLAGGLSTAAACRLAGDHCAAVLVPEIERLVAAIGRSGVAGALGSVRGPLSGIATAIGTATASGAPVLPALESHLRQEHHSRHMERVEAARRLPIRLMVPLTLLVLPGFVLITVGPAVIDSLARLGP